MAQPGMLAGVGPAIAYLLLTALSSVSGCLFFGVLLLLVRAVLRRAAIAAGVVLLVLTTVLMIGQGGRHGSEALRFSESYGQAALLWMLTTAGIALFGAYRSLGGKPLLKSWE